MASKYNPVDLANDASQFAASRFGKHYLQRLNDTVERELRVAMDTNYNDSYRAHAATKAAACKDELDYFKTAQSIKNNPDLLARMAETLKFKKGADPTK